MKTLMFLLFTVSFIPANAQNIGLYSNKESGRVQFAVSEIDQALNKKKIDFAAFSNTETGKMKADQTNIILISLNEKVAAGIIKKAGIKNAAELKSEGFIIHKAGNDNRAIYVLGYDDAGTMYGGLEVAEIIKVNGIDAVQNQLQNPYMKVRGTKYNIPLDMRSPTYTEPSDAAQNNMAEMWNFDFWKEYIDNLARYRYNLISLWNMHPFPSMVKVPEYPDIALSDVRKSTGDWKENYSLNGWGFDAPEIMKSYEVLKKMTIEEKIEFWRKVMAYGKQRNVRFYVVTWNIFVYGIDGKYGITDKPDNPVTTDYFRKSIKQMVLTYPDLAGIGLTTGENMYDYTATQKEEWAYATYGQGVLDALKEQPNRKIDFIHRQHQTQAKEITSIFTDVMKNENINFVFSFKYAQAHVYSSVNQVFHQEFVKDIQSENLKTLWTLRNDDNFYFRWGAPDFVRDFIKNIPYDVSEGFYYGSDQYVWGREFLEKYADGPRELEIVKHWYQWMCWGRLGYNPNMGNDRFVSIIQSRFPSVNAQEMFDAWQSASMIYPWVTGFHWGALDFQWYIESGQSTPNIANTPSGYHDVNRFITLPPHKGTGYISIPNYTKAFLTGSKIEGETPLQVADKIIQNSERALKWADAQSQKMNKELRITIDDIKTMARLGKNYGHKIRGATYLSLFRETLQREWYNKAIEELNTSAGYWRHYAASGLASYYNPLWTNRVGYVDWRENFNWSLFDVIANGAQANLPSMQPTAGGTILEAEAADFKISGLKSEVTGFTGTGYLETKVGDAKHQVKWTYNAPVSGSYILEFRYTLKREQIFLSPVEVNGKKVIDIEFWNTGNAGNWVWERVTVKLEKGENKISISPEGFVLLDHLNIIMLNAESVEPASPIIGTDVVFYEENGIAAVEAEHFYKQVKTELRQWFITSKERVPLLTPDPDGDHIAGASGNAYLEILPDTRRTPADKLYKLEDPNVTEETARLVNFTDLPGKIAVLHYRVNISQPGRYYVWVRAHSTGPEDNSLHVGFNDTWPANGQRMQWCDGKNQWTWESKQRTEKEHCGVPKEIYLDIEKAGIHDIQFSMREDGFEFDKFILTNDINYIPSGEGPAPKLLKGTLPVPFPKVAQRTDLVNKWDTIRPLVNPDKGWYHHMLDNGINKYLIQDEKDLTGFPGMDHLYLRLAWACLELNPDSVCIQ